MDLLNSLIFLGIRRRLDVDYEDILVKQSSEVSKRCQPLAK